MDLTPKLVILIGAAAIAPAALAGNPPSTPGKHASTASEQPGPNASLPAKAKAYGRYCQNQSKQHVAGQKGTPFSQCVTAMAKLATGQTNSPRTACATLSKKHLAGETGTPFSRCVVAGAKLLKDRHTP
jgi:hypothetical protein